MTKRTILFHFFIVVLPFLIYTTCSVKQWIVSQIVFEVEYSQFDTQKYRGGYQHLNEFKVFTCIFNT